MFVRQNFYWMDNQPETKSVKASSEVIQPASEPTNKGKSTTVKNGK